MNRRDFLLSAAAGVTIAKAAAHRKLNVSIFSKHLQFLQGEALAKAVAEIGFDGIDLAVRPGGHVEPERAAQDLPPLRLQHEHNAHLPQDHFRRQALEPSAVSCGAAGAALIFIDDFHSTRRPAQLGGPLPKMILPFRAFTIAC